MITKFSPTLFGVILVLGSVNVANSAPINLSNAEMDSVTAGTIIITAAANANASGSTAYTNALTHTTVRKIGNIEIGYGVAQASACCSADATANALTTGYADGQRVIIRQINRNYSTLNSQYAYSSILVISINKPITTPAMNFWYPRS